MLCSRSGACAVTPQLGVVRDVLLQHAFTPFRTTSGARSVVLLRGPESWRLHLTTCTRSYTQQRKRFYKTVNISQEDGAFQISLDRRRLRTPMGNIVKLPNEPLALSVATEWEAQKDIIRTSSMYMSRLCNKAIDNPLNETAEERIEQTLPFLDTDTICFRAEEPPVLAELQQKAWDPVMKWVEKRFDVAFGSSTSVIGPEIPDGTKEKLRKLLRSFDAWSLVGFQEISEALKSVILALALVERHISVETAVALSRLEEEYQIGHWGRVEWSHDVEVTHIQAAVAAALMFVQFNQEVRVVSQKLPSDTNKEQSVKSTSVQ
ncbi:hypothetical protein RvY_05811 [Ramazzottius varieornatus]|uniref:ATP synthase mitochondrial F1 complex assembly factor 2 n=1 Tax=Ramazzottius varieornatus TaxID=947166 RepID=A0A1D1UZC7_RAMVA|nr:hypothetical protein RvY_05811 [Ramazzottius varieornatus]